MPVILATWLGRLRLEGLEFKASPGKKVCKTLQLNGKKLGMVAHTCHPSYSRKCKVGCGPGQPGQKVRPYLQNNQSKKDRRHSSTSVPPKTVTKKKPRYICCADTGSRESAFQSTVGGRKERGEMRRDKKDSCQ
jgi:hypothetical protein